MNSHVCYNSSFIYLETEASEVKAVMLTTIYCLSHRRGAHPAASGCLQAAPVAV